MARFRGGDLDLKTTQKITQGEIDRLDGTGKGTFNSLQLDSNGSLSISTFTTDTTLAGNSDATIPTEKAIKTYVDTQIASVSSTGQDGLQGTVTLASGINYRDVTYATTLSGFDSDYSLQIQLENTVDANPSSYTHVITARDFNGFTVLFSSTLDSANYKLHYVAGMEGGTSGQVDYYYYDVDSTASDQGATSDVGGLTLYDIVQTVGTSKYAIAYLRHNPENGNTTTYTFDTSLSLSSYPNLFIKMDPGAVLSRTTGDEVLTIYSPDNIEAATNQKLTSVGMLAFSTGGRAIYPEWWGAVGDGSTDDGAAINLCANAGRSHVIPVKFSAKNYYTTVSLNFTGANYDQGFTAHGWIVSGGGPGATLITGNLTLAYPIVDLSDCRHSILRDVRIYGHASGNQICGLLHARVAGTLAVDNKTQDVVITGTFSEAAVINFSSDLPKYEDSYFDGPCGAIITTTLTACDGNIDSAYQTLTEVSDSTLCNFINTEVHGYGGDSIGYDSAIVMYEWGTIDIDAGCYIAQTGTGKAGIYVYGRSGVGHDFHTIKFHGRYENQTSPTASGTFLWHDSEQTLGNCVLDGHVGGLGSPDAGQLFYLQSGDILFSRFALDPIDSNGWSHFVQRAGATSHVIRDSEIFEQTVQTGLQSGDAALFGAGNKIHLRQWNSNWMNVSGYTTFFTADYGRIDINPWVGFNQIGQTTSLARCHAGHITTTYVLSNNSGPSGSDITHETYTLPGDLFYTNNAQNRGVFKAVYTLKAASNTNTKTIKVKFGVAGSETSMIQNDVTTAPNGSYIRIEVDICRVNSTQNWDYSCIMIVGSTMQTCKAGNINADPSSNTLDLILTINAAASDVNLRTVQYDLL